MRNHEHERRRKLKPAGFTLVEMVTVITILSVIGLVPSYVIVESMKVYAQAVPAMTAKSVAELAAGRMKHEIRDLKDTASITAFTFTAFTFEDSAGNTIAYSLSGSDLLRNGDLLAQGVTALAFTYWKSDGTTASSAADLHLVELDLTVQSASEPYRIQAVVFPRVLSP